MIAIKGGWLGRIPQWRKWELARKDILEDRKTSWPKWLSVKALDWIIDGTQLSAIFMFVLISFLNPGYEAEFALAWWLWVMSSMGEEAGAVGDYKEAWGDYIDHSEDFGRWYGIKKGLIYGIAGGGLLTFATGWVWFMAAGATFPLVYFVGNSLNRLIFKERGWAVSEILYDLVLIPSIFVWSFGWIG